MGRPGKVPFFFAFSSTEVTSSHLSASSPLLADRVLAPSLHLTPSTVEAEIIGAEQETSRHFTRRAAATHLPSGDIFIPDLRLPGHWQSTGSIST